MCVFSKVRIVQNSIKLPLYQDNSFLFSLMTLHESKLRDTFQLSRQLHVFTFRAKTHDGTTDEVFVSKHVQPTFYFTICLRLQTKG